MFRRSIAALAALLVLATLALPRTGAAATDERCFAETGFCIKGAIRAYWDENGGLAVFGYPITLLRTETVEESWTGPAQWFERDRLEDHSNERKGVLAGRLGARYLELQGRPWDQTTPSNPPRPGCRFFGETGFNLCGSFLRYWQTNGGLQRFGYPITNAYEEEIGGGTLTVQYFERRRMEYHPEHVGTPYEILLGLLGNDLFASAGSELSTYRSTDGTWSVQYPAFLDPEELGDGTVIFISRDRQSFAAIDSFRDGRGGTGAGLLNRARATLARIYGQAVREEVVITQWPPSSRWDAGISFTSPGGATGSALYEQRSRPRVNGFLYAKIWHSVRVSFFAQP